MLQPRFMPMVKPLIALTCGLVVLGLRFFWLPPAGALWFQGHCGYPILLGLFSVWCLWLLRKARRSEWFRRDRVAAHWPGIVAILLATAFLHVHEPHVMRVLYDEPSHSLGGMVMHLDKTAFIVSNSHWLGEQFMLTGYYGSFRQYFFSFLLSLIHDFTGYRIENVFILNFLLTPVALTAVYVLAAKLAGRLAGLFSLGLMATVPLFAQVVTSGEYDVLNTVMVLALIISTISYANDNVGREAAMNLSLATALLLSATRSESIIYLVPWAGIVGWIWWTERRVSMTWFAAFSPLFLLPNLVCNLILVSTPGGMDAIIRKNGEPFFSLRYLPEHLSETIFYLFNFNRVGTGSPLIAIAGVMGAVGLVVYTVSCLRKRALTKETAVFAVFTCAAFALYAFVLCNFWGSPTAILASRFILPSFAICAVLGGWFVVQFSWLRAHPGWLCAAPVFWAVVLSAPAASRSFDTNQMVSGRADDWFLEFAEQRDRKNTLYVERSNLSFIINRYASVSMARLEKTPERFVRALKAGLYREVFVLQLYEPHFADGSWKPKEGHQLPENFVLEPVEERMITPLYSAHVSRFLGYRKPDGAMVTAASDDDDVKLRTSFKNEAEWQEYRLSLYP